MASKYMWGENPIKDFFIQNLIDDIDMSTKKNFEETQNQLSVFIEHFLEKEKDIIYLDFRIKKDKFGGFNIIANNIITALWFSGIVPTDVNRINSENRLVYNKKEYRYNQKTKKLTIKKIK